MNLTEEYRQALKELNIARANYEQVDDLYEPVVFKELQLAEERVMAIIKEAKENGKMLC